MNCRNSDNETYRHTHSFAIEQKLFLALRCYLECTRKQLRDKLTRRVGRGDTREETSRICA